MNSTASLPEPYRISCIIDRLLQGAETKLSERLGIPPDYLSPIGMHLVLTIGILFFEWNFVELVLTYLTEIVIVAVLFAVVALFVAQPVDDHDASKSQEEPSPIQPIPVLPPIYRRNIGLIVENTSAYGVFFRFLAGMFVAIVDPSVSSLLSPTVGLTVLGICGSQLRRVWREFLVDHSYRELWPPEALELGLRPVARFIITTYVIVPTTVVVVTAVFAVPDVMSGPVVLLTYILPISGLPESGCRTTPSKRCFRIRANGCTVMQLFYPGNSYARM